MLALLAGVLLAAQEALSLQLKVLYVPTVVTKGDPVWLNCSYDLQGDNLYSIKWHKNNVEFYRYLPEDTPPAQKYELPGIYVELDRCRLGHVYMHYTDVESEGLYRCEVSAEAPSFQTVKGEKEMRIYVFPTENPRISGTRPHYSVGQEVNVVCESAPSRPAAFLKWLINSQEVPPENLIRQEPLESPEGLLTSTLGLRFRAQPDHFREGGGTMKLQCEAIISQAHTLSSEEILISRNATTNAARIISEEFGTQKEGPTITGGRIKYQVGDTVDVNCTASKSQPPAELHWYINDKEARQEFLIPYPNVFYSDGQEAPVLGLRFEVRPRHFHKYEMRLRCTATLSEVIRMSSEELEVDNSRQVSGLHIHENDGPVRSSVSRKEVDFSLLIVVIAAVFSRHRKAFSRLTTRRQRGEGSRRHPSRDFLRNSEFSKMWRPEKKGLISLV